MRTDSVFAAAVRDGNPCERLYVLNIDARRQYILLVFVLYACAADVAK